MHIGIFIYPEAEVLDFAGPYEVFSTAARLCPTKAPFKVSLIARDKAPVRARAGFRVIPDYDISQHPELDLLIIVGGVHTKEMDKPEVINWIRKQAAKVKLLASVCTGVFLLAKAQLISNHRVTTHWEDIADLKQQFPTLTVVDNVRWVDNGEVISSAGISAGIDMSLHLLERLVNRELALKTAKQMDFDWTENGC